MSTSASIPVVDFSSLSLNLGDDQLDETEMKLTASEMINAFTTTGFVYLSNTHFPDDLLKKATVVSDQFFDLPLSAKKKYARGGSYGYVESEQEFVNPERPGDLKECFNVYLELIDDTSRFPCDEVPDFMKIIMEFVQQCCLLSRRVFTALVHGLDLQDKNVFERCHNMLAKPGNPSVLRLLRYPPLPPAEEIKPNQVRLGEHCDYGTITLLFQLDTEGLQVQRRDGGWVDAVPIPNTVLINIGDLLQRWTSDKLISTCHRVMIPDDEVKRQTIRRSIVFFVHPDDDVTVECLDGSDKYPPVNGTEYLNDKLKASYFY